MQRTAPIRRQLGEFTLNLELGELQKGEQTVRLQEQPFQILLMLIDCAGGLLTRDEIKRKLWPNDTVVEFDHSIHTAISKLRQALGDSADKPKYVETIARRGYRLLVPTQELELASEEAAGAKASGEKDDNVAQLERTGLIGKTVSHYRVLGAIGGGGMGMVYKAEDLKLGRAVALKFLPEELAGNPVALQRFEREARMASSLSHPNICTIYEVEEYDGQPFIVMELLQGETLRDRLASANPGFLPLNELLHTALQICDGLQAAHARGIIHRDIKPANIFVTTSGQVKILDFGLAKLVTEPLGSGEVLIGLQCPPTLKPSSAEEPGRGTKAERSQRRQALGESILTRTGTAMGTASYMSPEQVRGEKLDRRTDLFSFGLILYEMSTRQRAFVGETAELVQQAILSGTPLPVRGLNSTIPAKLVNTIDKALQKDRERRYQSAAEMRSDLERLGVERGISLRRLSRWPVAVALLAVLAAGVCFYLQSRSRVALTNQDTVVLANFTNRTGDPVLGDALDTALRTELEQTPFLSILSSNKMRGALQQTGHPEDAKLTMEMARDICAQSNSKAVVGGSITDAGNHYRLELKAVGCQSGKTLATAEAEVGNRNEIVRMLGVAGIELRRKLGEPKESLRNFSKPLDEATSASPEALQAYTKAIREEPQRLTAAVPLFKRATELDPDYAMAYAWQAALGSGDVPMTTATKAYELRARLTERDRFAVEHMYYRDVTGELEKAIAVYEQWTRTFPLDSVPRIGLAIALSSLGQNERSAAEAREAIRLEPGIDGYDYLMLADISLGRFDDAKTVYEEALARKFDGPEMRLARYRLAFLQDDDAAIQEQVNWAAKTPGAEGSMLWSQFCVEAYHRHVRAAHAYAQRVMDWGRRMESSGSDPEHKAAEAMMDAEAGFLDRAHEEATWALGRASELSARLNVAMAFARVGDVPAAQKLVEELNREHRLDTVTQNYYLPTLRAMIDLDRNPY